MKPVANRDTADYKNFRVYLCGDETYYQTLNKCLSPITQVSPPSEAIPPW